MENNALKSLNTALASLADAVAGLAEALGALAAPAPITAPRDTAPVPPERVTRGVKVRITCERCNGAGYEGDEVCGECGVHDPDGTPVAAAGVVGLEWTVWRAVCRRCGGHLFALWEAKWQERLWVSPPDLSEPPDETWCPTCGFGTEQVGEETIDDLTSRFPLDNTIAELHARGEWH